MAPANQFSTDRATAYLSASAAYLHGDVFVRLESGSSSYRYIGIWRLSDGHTVTALLATGTGCGLRANSPGAPQLVPLRLPSASGDLFGISSLDDSPVSWSPLQHLPQQQTIFANDSGWGLTCDDGTVRVLDPPTATTLTTIDQSLLVSAAAARGDLVLWQSTVGNAPDILKGYRPGQPVTTIVSGTMDVINVSVSDTALAWIGASGPSVHDGTYQTSTIAWANIPGQLAQISAPGKVSVPGTDNTGLDTLQTGDDYIATVACRDDGCHLIVVRMSSASVWQIAPRAGTAFMGVMAVSGREILVSENDAPVTGINSQLIQRLVRIDLAHLDDLQANGLGN